MITKCLLIYALLVNNFGYGVADQVMDLTDCDNYVPETCYEYATLLVEHFDEKNIETAVKVMWCESRNKADAYRYQDQDSGLFQTIPRTWGWVKEQHDIPYWDYPVRNTYAQFIPRYNIKVAALLVQDMHTRDDYWKPWSSSQWCWEDTDKWIEKWQNEATRNN